MSVLWVVGQFGGRSLPARASCFPREGGLRDECLALAEAGTVTPAMIGRGTPDEFASAPLQPLPETPECLDLL